MHPDSLKLFRYRYGTAPVMELQDRLQAASVIKDISGKEDIQLSMLGSFEEPQTAFTPGDFIALKDDKGIAWSWGRVSVVRSTMKRDPGGMLTHAPYAVTVQGWYDFLTRSKVHVMTTSNRPSVGTLFNFPDWSAFVGELTKMYGTPAGQQLQFMLRKLLRIRLPPSLGGGWFHDEIPVVYDRATALRYAPEFADMEPVEFGNLMPQLSVNNLPIRSSDIGSLIANMFLFETSLVELIPYLSITPGDVPVPSTNPPSPNAPTAAASQNQSSSAPPANSGPSTPVDTRIVPGWTKLGNILGAQPVLVYRIKPFRAEPLYRAAVARIGYRAENAEQGYLDRDLSLYDSKSRAQLIALRAEARAQTTTKLVDDGLFKQVTFEKSTITPLPYDHIISVSRQRSDADRLNASSINAVPPAQPAGPGAQITDVDFIGLPVAIENQIENHGLRLRFARWSMYPDDTKMTDPTVYIYYRAVAAQVMQFYEKAHLYETGSMQLHFTHTLRATEDNILEFSTYDKSVLNLEPGNWFRTPIRGPEGLALGRALTPSADAPEPATPDKNQLQHGPKSESYSNDYFGYITTVSHNIQRMASGNLAASSQLNFIRGHFADMWDVLHGINVPMAEQGQPPNGAGGAQGQSVGGGGACGLRLAEPANALDPITCSAYPLFEVAARQFNLGEFRTNWGPAAVVPPLMNNPFSTGPTDNFAPNLGQNDYNRITQTYITQRPLWLRCWFLEAISVMPGNEYASIAQFMTTSTSAYSADPATAANHANLWALAACAYVIESYWRTYPGYENVHLRVRAIPRAKDAGYHLLYAAMDFYLEYPADFAGEQAGALQVWASLYKLAKEGRIPYGGRGLYLNVNPETGIKGTAFSEAGSPSKSNCQYPPGGSSWTHYDIRGMWGITTRKNSQGSFLPGFFTSWVGTDWNGDGSDEITLSNSFSPPKSRTQNGGVEDTAAYTWANVADSDFKLLEEYVSGTKSTQAPGVAAVMRARKARSDYLDVEKARDPVRAVLRSYFESNGTNDKWLKPVTTRVPNMFQVFELEQLLGASLNPITPYIAPDKKNFKAKLFFAKDIAGQIINAPVIVFFGGARVNGQSAGTYMETYASYLKGRNHLVIAENDKVTYGDVEPFITEAQFHAAGHPSTLFIFSNGVVPTRSWVAARGNVVPNSDFSVVCLVDAFLGGNPAIPVGQRTRANEITDTFLSAMGTAQSLYRFFYTEVWNMTGNGMYQQTRDRILGGGSYTGMTNLYRQLVPKGNATTDIEWHMDANRVAIQYLLDSGLAK